MSTPFGIFFEKVRRKRKLRQKELAAILEFKPAYISILETGRKPPSELVLERMIKFLNLSESEKTEMKRTAEISKMSLRVPFEKMSLEEFEMLDLIWQRLGTLSVREVRLIRDTISLYKDD